jgi:Uma2 family endonuclease
MAVSLATRDWTLEEMHRLPDDGNRYELVRGELFVTPAPTDEHETILARLTRILDPYVAANGLGFVYHPRAVLQFDGSEAEPDLMVRQPHPRRKGQWATAPTPVLIVEVLSPYTRRRDREQKREYYLDAGVAEYWMIDAEVRSITVVRAGRADRVVSELITWSPAESVAPLEFEVETLFGDGSTG